MRVRTSTGASDGQPAFGQWVAWFPRVTAAVVATVGLLALAGHIFDLPVLKSGIPGLVEMKANTAMCFVLVSVALWLLGGRRSRARGAGLVSCVA